MEPLTPLQMLASMKKHSGPRQTEGLPSEIIERFLAVDPDLVRAIGEAFEDHEALRSAVGDKIEWSEKKLIEWLQEDYVNFYNAAAVNPYIALAARGPWMVTAHGAVLHDSGGYGMLGYGQSPDAIIDAMSKPWVIANIMTPSFSQRRFADALKSEIGYSREGSCPFDRFICMNSGSESVTVASRISDVNAYQHTQPGARHAGKKVKFLAIQGGFHGRTDRPAQASDSSGRKYRATLHSFQNRDNLVTIPPNDIEALRGAFAAAEAEGVFFEMMLAEPVMGEGNPGMAMTRAFYDEARKLTKENGTLLLIDSIQAGLRAQGCLSIVDYPGFQTAEAPDMETYSKALNAAQFPLSVLACGTRAAELYVRGIYGNTMTTNPRALEVGLATLNAITPALRKNIQERGVEFVEKLTTLQAQMPEVITGVQGTGLLFSAELRSDLKVVGFGGVEEYLRMNGIGVIHGGENSLRFTPHFNITSAEVDLVVEQVGAALRHFSTEVAAK